MYGIINLYKKTGISSFKQINLLKSLFEKVKIGHTGTLDPLAEGVLVVCIGKATRLADYIQAQYKTYQTEMLLGLSSDSFDITGNVIFGNDSSSLSDEEIKSAILSFKGEQNQMPPIYSAKKVNGKRLYKYAINNEQVVINESKINIMRINVNEIANDVFQDVMIKKACFDVECSKGTYIRSLCKDIGDKLGVGGVMSKLTRTRVGRFTLENSFTIEALVELKKNNNIEHAFIPIEQAINLDHIFLLEGEYKKYMNGIKIPKSCAPGEYFIKSETSEIIGIGTVDELGYLKGKVMLL